MNFDLVDYDELEPIISFSINIIEYFKNDCIVISDFLKGKSPWDNNIKWYLKISEEELIKYKKEMITMIIKVYCDIIEKPILEQPDDGPKLANIVDLPYINTLLSGKDRVKAFFEDERIMVILFRVYIAVIKEEYNLNIDTANYFNIDLGVLINLYEELGQKYKLNDKTITEAESKNNFDNFYEDLVRNIDEYLSKNFRTKDEIVAFINYYFSIIYAYLKKKEKEGNELIEIDRDIIAYFEDTTSDLESFFCKYFDVRYYFIMSLYDMYLEYGPNFDFRYELTDSKSRKLFSLRDINFNNEKVPDYVVNDYSLDFRLDNLLKKLLICSEEEVYSILLSKEPIYNYLYYVGLDARYSEYYKQHIIRKILCDSYSYEKYLCHVNDNYQDKIVKDIENISFHNDLYINYFRDNFSKIYRLYTEFFNSSEYIKEQVYMYIYKNNLLKSVDRINDFTMAYYFDIMLGRLKQLNSVDCMNYYIDSINNNDINSNMVRIDYSKYGIDNLVKILCLNIYENILLLEDVSDRLLFSKDIARVRQVIEEVPDITSFALQNYPFFMKLFELFTLFNKENITYKEEIKKRSAIENISSKTILKRLNPYKNE